MRNIYENAEQYRYPDVKDVPRLLKDTFGQMKQYLDTLDIQNYFENPFQIQYKFPESRFTQFRAISPIAISKDFLSLMNDLSSDQFSNYFDFGIKGKSSNLPILVGLAQKERIKVQQSVSLPISSSFELYDNVLKDLHQSFHKIVENFEALTISEFCVQSSLQSHSGPHPYNSIYLYIICILQDQRMDELILYDDSTLIMAYPSMLELYANSQDFVQQLEKHFSEFSTLCQQELLVTTKVEMDALKMMIPKSIIYTSIDPREISENIENSVLECKCVPNQLRFNCDPLPYAASSAFVRAQHI